MHFNSLCVCFFFNRAESFYINRNEQNLQTAKWWWCKTELVPLSGQPFLLLLFVCFSVFSLLLFNSEIWRLLREILRQYNMVNVTKSAWQSELSPVDVAHVFPAWRDCDEFQIHEGDVFSKSTRLHALEKGNRLIYAVASAPRSALVFCLMNWLILYEQYEKQI